MAFPTDKQQTTVHIDRQIYSLLKAALNYNELTYSEWVEQQARRWLTVAMPTMPEVHAAT